jgi:predicted aspartyl protease
MISGVVISDREAVLLLRLRGSGLEVGVHAVIDTGFTGTLGLPQTWIVALAWPRVGSDELFLADGSRLQVDVYQGIVLWEGRERTIFANCVDATPFIGMSLIWNHLLNMEVVDGGPVSIQPMP